MQKLRIGLIWSLVAVTALGCRPTFYSGGSSAAVLMAIDEGHFNVHTADGSYRPLAHLAESEGIQTVGHPDAFTSRSLAGYDVLVIANARGAGPESPMEERARPAFTRTELDAVAGWVRGGGALLLVTDHGPTGSASAQLAQRFAVDVIHGSTRDSLLFDVAIGNIVFDRAGRSLGDHPITCGRTVAERVDRVATFTGGSLRGPSHAVPLLIFSSKAVDQLLPERLERPAFGRSQGLALHFGAGRVAVLAEAAMLRIFEDEAVQNRRFAQNLILWLAGRLTPTVALGCRGSDGT